jgi:serine/threonine-protein kinase
MSAREPGRDELERLLGATVGGKYRIERLLGRGGMGAVFAAQNTTIGKRVALKFLSREAARDRDAARRFQREAKAASLVESEHIVQVFDSGATEEGVPFLVMEHLTGEDLRARLAREQSLPVGEAVAIACQVLRALVRAHAAGIVHRDLKPDNVFLCRRDDGSLLVKIVDFGISKLDRGTLGERLTQRGSVLGSAYYMAPEQAQASDSVDQRSDLYGVGAILFEMLAGRPPHLGPTLESVLVAICTQTAPPITSLRPDVAPEIARTIARALEREPAARFANALEFLAALGAADATLGPPDTTLGKVHAMSGAGSGDGGSPGEAKPRDVRRPGPASAPIVVAGVVAALAGFALTALLVSTRSHAPKPDGSGREAAASDALPASTNTPPKASSAESLVVPAPSTTPLGAPAASTMPLVAPAPSTTPLVDASHVAPGLAPSSAAKSAPTPAPRKTGGERKRPSAPQNRGVASTLQLSTRAP